MFSALALLTDSKLSTRSNSVKFPLEFVGGRRAAFFVADDQQWFARGTGFGRDQHESFGTTVHEAIFVQGR